MSSPLYNFVGKSGGSARRSPFYLGLCGFEVRNCINSEKLAENRRFFDKLELPS